MWVPVREVSVVDIPGVVYNLEVEDDNSYIANCAVVHNCQGFSMAGKQLAFDDPRSSLYFEFERILNEVCSHNPSCLFLLENVKMKQESKDVITSRLGVEPIAINSSLVSAQSRYRLYWTNIKGVKQPEDQRIYTKNIVDDYKESSIDLDCVKKQVRDLLLTSKYKDNFQIKVDKLGRFVVLRPDGLKIQRIGRIAICQNKTEILTCFASPFICVNGVVRKVSVVEAERLQTLPDNYTKAISDSQRYKSLGNGWTVDVIAHILKGISKGK